MQLVSPNRLDDRFDKSVMRYFSFDAPLHAPAGRLDADAGPCFKSAGLLYNRKALRSPGVNAGCHVI